MMQRWLWPVLRSENASAAGNLRWILQENHPLRLWATELTAQIPPVLRLVRRTDPQTYARQQQQTTS